MLTPKGADQFLNGDLMAAAGLAAVLMPNECTADAIAMVAKSALVDPNGAAILAARAEIPVDAGSGHRARRARAPFLTVDSAHVARYRPEVVTV